MQMKLGESQKESYAEKKFSDIDISVAAIIAIATLSHSSRKTIFRLAVNKHIICVHTSLLWQAGAYLGELTAIDHNISQD